MVKPGDVVTVGFPGALGLKRRPAVVVSTDTYHSTRPDVVLGLLTSHTAVALGPTDYVLQDWSTAGLHSSSAFRVFLATLPATSVVVIGKYSNFPLKNMLVVVPAMVPKGATTKTRQKSIDNNQKFD